MNRIIAVVVLVAVVAIAAQGVSCAFSALAGSEKETEASPVRAVSAAAGIQAELVKPRPQGSASGVEDPWVASGLFTTGNGELDELVKELCDRHTIGDDASENARNSFICMLTEFEYGERTNNRHPDYVGWDVDYALQFFTEGSGNCFNNSALTQWILRYFGYDDAHVEPIVVLMQSGAWSDHGAVFVTDVFHGNRECVIDDALHEDGWMLDADTYVYKVIDIGQEIDPDGFYLGNSEGVLGPPSFWYDPSVYGDTDEGEAD